MSIEENEQRHSRIDELISLLSDPLVSSLFAIHPNTVGADCSSQVQAVPDQWQCWWSWAAENIEQWKKLVIENSRFHKLSMPELCNHPADELKGTKSILASCVGCTSEIDLEIPYELRNLIRDVNRLSLPRAPTPDTAFPTVPPTDYITHPHPIGLDPSEIRFTPSSKSNAKRRPPGMSPKKAHEVERFTSYIAHVLMSLSSKLGVEVRHIVDVGAGQGYLSRALHVLPYTHSELLRRKPLHVLALDSAPNQTAGAQRRQTFHENNEASGEARAGLGTLTHRTVQIANGTDEDSEDELARVVDEWLSELQLDGLCSSDPYSRTTSKALSASASSTVIPSTILAPIPIIFVALHACGSLTPTILRSVLGYRLAGARNPLVAKSTESQSGESSIGRRWYAVGCTVVGCCYNLLEPRDFPLSAAASAALAHASNDHPLNLTPSHLQLASQVPSQWLRTHETASAAALALKKVVFRALLEGYLRLLSPASSLISLPYDKCLKGDGGKGRKKLGKMNVRVYESFDVFLRSASVKMGIDFSSLQSSSQPSGSSPPHFPSVSNVTRPTTLSGDIEAPIEDSHLACRLQVLHVLRCLLGPAVESLIILDRYLWLQEKLTLPGTSSSTSVSPPLSNERSFGDDLEMEMSVRLVNLFDQAMDSGRNVGIVVAPRAVFS